MFKDLTAEQKNNLMAYGFCRICLAPRETKLETKIEGKNTVTTFGIVCPNGHPQL